MVAESLLSVAPGELVGAFERQASEAVSRALALALMVAERPAILEALAARRAEVVASVPDVEAVQRESDAEQARLGDILAMVRREVAVPINLSTWTRADSERREALYKQERELVGAIDDARRRGEAAVVVMRQAAAELVALDERADVLRSVELGSSREVLASLGDMLSEV